MMPPWEGTRRGPEPGLRGAPPVPVSKQEPKPKPDTASAAISDAVATLMRAAEGEVCSEIVAWLRQMADEERKRAEWTDAAALDAGDIVHTLEGDKIRSGAHALCAAAKQIEDGTWRQHAKGPAGGQVEQAKPGNAEAPRPIRSEG